MRLHRTLRVSAALAASALLLTACGGGDGEPTVDDGDTGTAAADLPLITEGTLTVCSDVPYPPFEFEDPDSPSGYSGFDLDLMQAIAEKLGLELVVQGTGFDPIQSGTAMAAGQCDIAASAITITEEREENIDFSEPYYDALQSLLVPTDSDIATLDDVAGGRLGVQSATTGEAYANDNAPDDAEIVSFENPGDLFVALEAGDLDAILQDLPVNAERARQFDNVEVIEEYDTDEQYGFAVTEEGAEALLEAVNGALAELREDGTYDSLYDEYFATE
jgi:polar amino acid transport system substrate-binding protein